MQQMSCPCGLYHGGFCNSFSMYWPPASTPSMAPPPPPASADYSNYYYSSDSTTGGRDPYNYNNNNNNNNNSYSQSYSYSSPDDNNSSSPPESHVDCTLSLGTPSTRRDSATTSATNKVASEKKSSSKIKGVSNFCWDFLQTATGVTKSSKSSRSGNNVSSGGGGDPLVARRCANCDTTSTPLWRNGPGGPKSLCNACGIRFKKEERRAAAAATTNHGGMMMMATSTDSSTNTGYYNNSGYHQQQHKVPHYSNDYGYAPDGQDSLQFLSWRLNVADQHRPAGLVHDFTY